MINYRHPTRPGTHHVTVGDVTPDLYTDAYDWRIGADVWVRVPVGAPARHAAPVRPVCMVKHYV